MKQATEKFESEVALCARFLSTLPKGWTPYAETAGWDILLVRDADGFQIGIEAKLVFNAHVLTQALEDWYGSYIVTNAGPDCRAVLVPEYASHGLGRIAAFIGVTVITMHPTRQHAQYNRARKPDLPLLGKAGEGWHEWAPSKRHALPEFVPDVAAGASAPLQLTDWKIKTIKIAVTLERRGYVTRADFKQHDLDHRRFFAREFKWLTIVDGRCTAGPSFPNVKQQHPIVFAKVAAEADKWLIMDRPLVEPKKKKQAVMI